jgi:hypothetical protein
MDLTGKAAAPREARRVRLLWALPPLILAAAIAVSVVVAGVAGGAAAPEPDARHEAAS